jgi:uncharacterized membrane protein
VRPCPPGCANADDRESPREVLFFDIFVPMNKGRLEAFSDGVLAIIITIMVLELKIPHGSDFSAIRPLFPVFLTYVLSFIYIGIYWNNHHHLVQTMKQVNAQILWANLHLLFWLSLVPFATGWMGENHFAPLPTAVYGLVLLCAALAYEILQYSIMKHHGPDHVLVSAVGKDWKGKLSLALYLLAIPLAFVMQWISDLFYIAVAAMWLIPDRRIASKMVDSVR